MLLDKVGCGQHRGIKGAKQQRTGSESVAVNNDFGRIASTTGNMREKESGGWRDLVVSTGYSSRDQEVTALVISGAQPGHANRSACLELQEPLEGPVQVWK